MCPQSCGPWFVLHWSCTAGTFIEKSYRRTFRGNFQERLHCIVIALYLLLSDLTLQMELSDRQGIKVPLWFSNSRSTRWCYTHSATIFWFNWYKCRWADVSMNCPSCLVIRHCCLHCHHLCMVLLITGLITETCYLAHKYTYALSICTWIIKSAQRAFLQWQIF